MAVCALAIAGSDPSGGAGVQADLRVFSALGAAGLSAITALTVQSSHGVQSVHPVDADILSAQIEAVLNDRLPEAVKIGMLCGKPQVRATAAALQRFHPPNIVLDPIFFSTSGAALLDKPGRKALAEDLLPLCDLVTPNMQEAAILTGGSVATVEEMRVAAEQLVTMGAKAALVTGGHLEGQPVDVLATASAGSVCLQEFRQMRVRTEHTHGTGCFLSSATAAYLAFGAALAEAVGLSGMLLNTALRSPTIVGQGRGYPDVWAAIRERQRD
jgi:hydroxymethylpyrimidine/phosphomethylpyrimidine kinase